MPNKRPFSLTHTHNAQLPDRSSVTRFTQGSSIRSSIGHFFSSSHRWFRVSNLVVVVAHLVIKPRGGEGGVNSSSGSHPFYKSLIEEMSFGSGNVPPLQFPPCRFSLIVIAMANCVTRRRRNDPWREEWNNKIIISRTAPPPPPPLVFAFRKIFNLD